MHKTVKSNGVNSYARCLSECLRLWNTKQWNDTKLLKWEEKLTKKKKDSNNITSPQYTK